MESCSTGNLGQNGILSYIAADWPDALIVANKHGLGAFRGKVYVDATGDGDLAAWAGAPASAGSSWCGSWWTR